jgi:hypothetical protein
MLNGSRLGFAFGIVDVQGGETFLAAFFAVPHTAAIGDGKQKPNTITRYEFS